MLRCAQQDKFRAFWTAPIFFYDDLITFASPVTYTWSTLTTTSHTPPAMTAGVYYWQVRARDAAENWSAPSTGWKITIK